MENVDFFRKVHMPKVDNNHTTTLITSISKPNRLNEFLPQNITKVYFPDHYYFSIYEIKEIIAKYNTKTLLMTKKDFIKFKELDTNDIKHIKVEIIYLEVKISNEFLEILNNYIKSN
jgi:tetraacyldisaccharide 4'-kinase